MEDDGFTMVTGKKAWKPETTASSQRYKKVENGYTRIFGSEEDIDKAMESAKAAISSSGLVQFLQKRFENLIKAGDSKKISKIFLIGNGHFDWPGEQGAHQFALFLEISRIFDAKIIFQEPILSDAEAHWIRSQENVEIREKMDCRIDLIDENEHVSILAIIHGEHPILNGILEHNWQMLTKQNRKRLIVIGNNYLGVHWEMSTWLKSQNTKIDEFVADCEVECFPAVYEPHPHAFRSTAITSAKNEC